MTYLEIRPLALLLAGFLALPAAPAPPASAGESIKDSLKEIERALRTRKYDKALEAATAIAKTGGAQAAEALFDAGLKIDVPQVYKGILDLLAGMTDDGALGFFEKESLQGKAEARGVFLADILGKMGGPRAADLLGNLLGSPGEPVARAALASLEKIRLRQSVTALLRFLEKLEAAKDRGLLYQETRDALYALTGQDFDALEDWKKWWEPIRETYDPDKTPQGATRAVRKIRDNAPEFAGKKIFSKNVLFVIDTSGTMQYVLKDDIPGLTWSDGSDSGKVTQGPKGVLTAQNAILAKFWSRIEIAKRELVKALGGLGPNVRANVIEFNRAVRPLEKQVAQLTPKLKETLLRRVQNMTYQTAAGTNTLGALEQAFGLDPRVTEIYFLSDGLPSADGKKNDDPLPILDKLESLNRFRKIKVHTFGYDPISLRTGEPDEELERANEFLRKLAQRTNGSFTLLKVTDEKPPPGYR